MVATEEKPRFKLKSSGVAYQLGTPASVPPQKQAYANFQDTQFTGDKFLGGFGATQLQNIDYWTLRARSAQLFNDNLYARGLIRRLITNEINTGLTPEACPDEEIIGVPEDSLDGWTETVENRFGVWGKNPEACDWKQKDTFGAIQRYARTEALVEGDILVVMRQNPRTNMPLVQLIAGGRVRSPLDGQVKLKKGHKIKHGVELDTRGRHVAHWVKTDDGKFERIPARGARGRRISWLVYGTDKRMDEVRGQPLLSLVLQSLKEIDRYRDSAQRKAVINSILAMFIKKGDDKPGTLPLTGGAVRRDTAQVQDGDGGVRDWNIAGQVPGLVMEELQTGEEPIGFHSQGTDINFGVFEASIVQAIAWANEIPPEILTLAFSNNYSASQAAINEFKIYLNKVWSMWGETFCTPIYVEVLISETLLQKIKTPGFLEAWRDPSKSDIFGAWIAADWYGSIKPSTDMLKQAKGSKLLTDEGWSTNARESRTLTGTKFSKNMKRLKRENKQKAEALEPLLELQQKYGEQNVATASAQNLQKLDLDELTAAVVQTIEEEQRI